MKVTILGINADREEIAAFVRGKLERVKERFQLNGSEIALWLRDTNGPRGGVDLECSIRLRRARQSPVVVKFKHSSLRVAVLGAIARLRRVLAS